MYKTLRNVNKNICFYVCLMQNVKKNARLSWRHHYIQISLITQLEWTQDLRYRFINLSPSIKSFCFFIFNNHLEIYQGNAPVIILCTFWLGAYLMKIIPEMCRAHWVWMSTFLLFNTTFNNMSVICIWYLVVVIFIHVE